MIRKLFVLFLVFAFTSNSLVFAENWVFTAADQVNNQQQYNVSYPSNNINNQSDDTYYGYAQTADMLDNYRPASTVVPAQTYNTTYTPVNTQNYSQNYTQPQTQTKTAKKEKEGTFSQRHPVLTGVGIGTLAVGAVALGLLLSGDNRNSRRRHYNSHCSSCSSHHRCHN